MGKICSQEYFIPKAVVQNRRDSFLDKQKLKEFMTTKPTLQEILKGTL